MRSLTRAALLATCLLPVIAAGASPTVTAQEAAFPSWLHASPVDADGLAPGPFGRMEMLYERTIFRVDVLHLTLLFGPETAAELERLTAGARFDSALTEPVAEAALSATEVLIRGRFLRDIDLEQFLEGVDDNLRNARTAGMLSEREAERIAAGLAEEYAPLRDRGIRAGDTIWYRVSGDRVQSVLEQGDGQRPVALSLAGSEHRRAVLASYLAPDSDFRLGLVRSLFADAN